MAAVHRLVPRLVVRDADAAIAFYTSVFGAEVRVCHRTPSGAVVHAEVSVGEVAFFVKDADTVDLDAHSVGGTPVLLSVYTDDVDALWAAALQGGAEVIYDLQTRFYGERGGRLRDPFGHVWLLSQIVEQIEPEEMDRRLAQNASTPARRSELR